MEADITAHYDEEDRAYTLLCAYIGERASRCWPRPIWRAISARSPAGSYEAQPMRNAPWTRRSVLRRPVSPVASLPRLMAAAASGYPAETGEEDVDGRKGLRVAFDLADEEGTLYATWFDQETLLPLRSEISAGGKVLYEVAWKRFEVTGQAPAEPEAPEAQPETPDAQSAPQEDGGAAQTPALASEGEDGGSAANPTEPGMASPADEAAAYATAEE